MSGYHTLKFSKALDDLEHQIKTAKVVEVQYHQSEQDLAIRKLIEYAKPTQTLDEVVNTEPTRNKHIGSSFDDFLEEEGLETSKESSEKFKESFREVLRLAKAGQQSWWTDRLKESTNTHIECMDEYYRQNYSDETTD